MAPRPRTPGTPRPGTPRPGDPPVAAELSLDSVTNAEIRSAFDAERALVMRRRLMWYCGIAVGLLLVSLLINVRDVLRHGEGADYESSLLDGISDVVLITIFAGAWWFARVRAPCRECAVEILTWIGVLASSVVFLTQPLANALSAGDAVGKFTKDQLILIMGGIGLFAAFVLHFLGSLLIALTPRESLRTLLPTWVVYLLIVAFLYPGHWWARAALVAAFPLAFLPGLLWSWWRFSRAGERFWSRTVAARYGEVAAELTHARQIHEALFPPPIDRGPVRLTYRYVPMREIGGDFLFVHPLSHPPAPADGPCSIVLIDVSGHGVPAALTVNRLHGELQRFFAERPGADPADVLRALNAYAFAALSPQSVYATAMVLRVDPAERRLAWAGAGHPPAFLRRASGDTEELASSAMMLGVLGPVEFHAESGSTRLAAGDVLIAYTDGATETRDERHEDFSIPRLRRLAGRDAPRGRLAGIIMDEVARFRKGRVTDDTLIVEAWVEA
jgi:hypothetical protein